MLDVSRTAAANSADRRVDAAALVATDPTGTLADFQDFVGGSRLSSNVSADKVVEWDAAGRGPRRPQLVRRPRRG